MLVQTILSFLLGIGFFTLGIIQLVTDLPSMGDADDNETAWNGLSNYEKDYFNNDANERTVDEKKDIFMSTRWTNSLLVGLFTLLTGIIFIVIGSLLICLYKNVTDGDGSA